MISRGQRYRSLPRNPLPPRSQWVAKLHVADARVQLLQSADLKAELKQM